MVLITEVSSIKRSLNTLQYYTGTQNGVLITEVSSIQRSLNTLQYYTGTQNGVLITEVSSIQRSFNTLQYYTGTQNGVLITEVCNREVHCICYHIVENFAGKKWSFALKQSFPGINFTICVDVFTCKDFTNTTFANWAKL